MNRYAADAPTLLDDEHLFVELCRLDGSTPSGRSAANHDEVVLVHEILRLEPAGLASQNNQT
ncbi:hypothetical protein D3C87_2013070 [compost metagenome]